MQPFSLISGTCLFFIESISLMDIDFYKPNIHLYKRKSVMRLNQLYRMKRSSPTYVEKCFVKGQLI